MCIRDREYRADNYGEKIGNDYLPFKRNYRWRPNHWLYENYNDNGVVFKLDIYFNSDGSARIDFWNPHQPIEIQKANTSQKLDSIQLISEFQHGGFGGGMFKVFKLENFKNLESMDLEIYNFVKNLFKKLRE